MSVNLNAMRDEMVPGLRIHYEVLARARYAALEASFKQTQEIVAANIFNASIVKTLPAPSLPVALAMGAAVAVIKNPKTTRRGLVSWVSNRFSGLDI